ncbi:hypothetical protein OF83DRAFT_125494 [Amylostereum chailletii]|nr:hypothetical protein OF83DRAFT_125494 [Amylostereum chailletii]
MAGQAVARPATRPMYMEGTGFAHAPKASVIHGPWAPVPEPVKCSRMEAVAGWNWDRDAAGAARDTPYSPSSWSRLSSPSSCRRSTLDLDLTSVELSLFSAAPPYPVVVDGFESNVFKCGPPAGRAGTRYGQDGTELWRYQKEYGGGEGWRETETLERAGTRSLAEMRSTELSGLWTDRDEVEEARWVAVWMGGFGSVEREG